MKLPDSKDITRSSDYGADENDPKVAQIQSEWPPRSNSLGASTPTSIALADARTPG